ncbi:protein strawberry notch homolog 1-like [Mya arenaria]|uniref:protein strawberry notch homolog 1-like n=1 Tax=Mya arenaria TaxID=6604 RepID=UPI0022E68AA5|nr:protein strawberry notch homolog 1-like [Mya arenaria]XP_052821364.1 protein strawberry notch homolog 1-like [Mya arenaria]
MSQPGSVGQTAHAVFLSQQPSLHPVLQQIQQLRETFAEPPVTRATPSEDVQVLEPPASNVDDEHGQNETISAEVFSSYLHREVLAGCKPHPGDIVEAGPLAAITPPDVHYPLADSLPAEIIQGGKLSSLQLEGVIQACQRHQMLLPDGQRAGFFIGDAAGVGKGRQIAGVILDNFARGRTKSIWFTISTDLIVDTRRDLGDLGCYIRVIDGCQELDKHTRVLGLPSDFKDGVVFSTYSTLVSTVQKGAGRQTRLQQLVDWCGREEFDGCLIFDECHKAKNFVPGKEQASTKVALAVTSIQRMLPKARVLYCSATGVSDVKNMAFMERLGLWGEGAPYNNFEQFLVSVQKKGLGMAEILAMEMKSAGMYLSRGLSYKQAEFVTVEAPLTKDQKKVYDMAVHLWTELRKALESALVRTGSSNQRVWQQFWSCHQRFFKQLCLGMKVPTIISEARQALASGQCIVIGLQTTGEASLDSELERGKGQVVGFMSLCREILQRFISTHFPTRLPPTKEGEVVEDKWCVTARNMLQDFTKRVSLPDSPLDEIIDKLGGPSQVAEMTGRKGRIVRHSPSDSPRYEPRTPDNDAYGAIDSLNVQERNHFMSGKKLVAIISDAASTGISLHSDLRVGNQCRRVHLTVELPWSADKAVQQLGRSHRSNQSSGPLYKLLTTNLGGERRFAAAVARRLQSLGALTKGDRRAATGADLSEFNFDTAYGRNALRLMYQHICQKKLVPGISLAKLTDKYDIENFHILMQESLVLMGLVDIEMMRNGLVLKDRDTSDVSKFLNRILGLHVEKQNMIFTYFTESMKLIIQNAKKEGRYNEGMLDITAASVEMVGTPREIFTLFNKGHTSTRLVELNVDRGMSWEQAVTRADNYSGKYDSFYVSRRDVWGRKLFILATQKEGSTHLFRIARPNTGLSYMDEERTDLLHRYLPIDREKAEKGWREQYEVTMNSCVHGSHCKNKDFCKVGSRCYSLHLLCGSIVTFMSTLEAVLNRNALKLNLSKTESSIRVVRVKCNDGTRVVGVRYPQLLISEVEASLREQRVMETLQQTQLKFGQSGNVLQPGAQATMPFVVHPSQAQYSLIIGSQSPRIVPNMLDMSMSQPVGGAQSVSALPASQPLNTSDLGAMNASSPVFSDGLNSANSRISLNSSSSAAPGEPCAKSSASDALHDEVKQLADNANAKQTVKFRGGSVTEEVSPVSKKCLAKALNPPVTIKNFFKPKVKAESSNSRGNCDQDEEVKEREVKEDGQAGVGEKVIVSEMSYEQFLDSGSDSKAVIRKPEGETELEAHDEHHKAKATGNVTLKEEENGSENVFTQLAEHSKAQDILNPDAKGEGNRGFNKENTPTSLSRKRALGDPTSSSQPRKKAKQATLFSTFEKMASKKIVEEQKEQTCPICQKVFEKSVSNAELNNHIDNCIIE